MHSLSGSICCPPEHRILMSIDQLATSLTVLSDLSPLLEVCLEELNLVINADCTVVKATSDKHGTQIHFIMVLLV